MLLQKSNVTHMLFSSQVLGWSEEGKERNVITGIPQRHREFGSR